MMLASPASAALYLNGTLLSAESYAGQLLSPNYVSSSAASSAANKFMKAQLNGRTFRISVGSGTLTDTTPQVLAASASRPLTRAPVMVAWRQRTNIWPEGLATPRECQRY